LRGWCRRLLLAAICSGSVFSLQAQEVSKTQQVEEQPEIQEPSQIEEVVVFGDSALAEKLGRAGSWMALGKDEITAIGATNISETMSRFPGVWVVRGSGQEHLTAIRSAVLTGPGACGAFQFLEDAIPIRPAGFCNVNNLFEVNSEQAAGIEVWRGPASAVLGGNALYGAINILTDLPQSNSLTFEGGPYDFYRISGEFGTQIGNHEIGAAIHGSSDNGYRDSTGVDQQKATFAHRTSVGDWEVFNTLNWTNLNQETGGYVYGYKAYKDNQLRKTNPNPEAYRDAWSVRAASHWTGERWRISPYLRASDMKFLQHFLPGQPREKNNQASGGVIIEYDWPVPEDLTLRLGMQSEYMAGHVDEYQKEALTDSSAFNNAVRNQGTHYDYDVDSAMVAGYYNFIWSFTDSDRLVNSVRVEYLNYDYNNKGLDGNTRDDGTECGFGGCLYLRPADRSDDYSNVAGRLGLEHDFDYGTAYAVVGSGFRPPQATELYRLQRGQDVADLDSEQVVSFEVGFKAGWFDIAAFTQQTDHVIFRDAAGFNLSDGQTKSWGVEFNADRTFGRHTFAVAGTYAVHEYAFNSDISGAEVVENGNQMDSAPKWMGGATWDMQVTERLQTEVEMVYQHRYQINAENTASYSGQTVWNLRGRYQLFDNALVFARVINLLDKQYADRGDWTFFNPERYRYFPAMPRQLYVGVTVDF
jgi:iron complex outermembrane recepter protein